MRDRGLALIGVGEASGEGRAAAALQQALTNPLLESTDISQATGVLASFSGGQDMSLFEVEEALALLRDKLNTDTQACALSTTPRPSPLAHITSPPPHRPSLLAPHPSQIIFGATFDKSLDHKLRISLVVAGLEQQQQQQQQQQLSTVRAPPRSALKRQPRAASATAAAAPPEAEPVITWMPQSRLRQFIDRHW